MSDDIFVTPHPDRTILSGYAKQTALNNSVDLSALADYDCDKLVRHVVNRRKESGVTIEDAATAFSITIDQVDQTILDMFPAEK